MPLVKHEGLFYWIGILADLQKVIGLAISVAFPSSVLFSLIA